MNELNNKGIQAQIRDIQGHCMHSDAEDCWYQTMVDNLRKEECDEDVVDRRLADMQDQALLTLITEQNKQTAKAFGGCTHCYGKGYATGSDMWAGYDTDGDIDGCRGRISGGNPNAMKFCECDRGKQLEQRFTEQVRLGRIDELNNVMGNMGDNRDCTTCYTNNTKLERHYRQLKDTTLLEGEQK